MSYAVKEIFLTLQGEGVHAGRRAVFLRFAGCNLWSGREEDRSSAICQFCDTDFVGMDGENGGRYEATALAALVAGLWGEGTAHRYIVLTGGEPMLQVDDAIIDALHAQGFMIAIESNGTLPVHPGIDWVCVSPKAGTTIVVDRADELKLVYPQQGMEPWLAAARIRAPHQWLSPMDGPDWQANASAAIAYAKMDARWRVNIQAHKFWRIK